jgi:hypothetical protein
MVIISVFFLIILSGISLFVNVNLLKKCEVQESMIIDYETLFNKVNADIEDSDKRLKELDQKGAFASDDEIGFFFKSVKDIQDRLNLYKRYKQ